MAEQVGFDQYGYTGSIVQVMGPRGMPVGTGFLIAPGYVLTCAHVVLQALHIQKQDFGSYRDKPLKPVSIKFPVRSDESINAEVVAWSPYQISNGDIAGLKLLTPEPEAAKPLPLGELANPDESEEGDHEIYGFGDPQGGCSDAYVFRTFVEGGRYQFRKVTVPDDETIKPGFSGAPVWNEAKGFAIAMIATARVAKDTDLSHTAHAIPKAKLQPILNRISACHLADVLQQCLDDCDSDDERQSFDNTLMAVLSSCHPDMDLADKEEEQTLQAHLIALSDRPSPQGWETEGKVVWFAVRLALKHTEPGIPKHAYKAIKHWVTTWGYAFPFLLERAVSAANQTRVASSHICQHLMVSVEPDGVSAEEVRVSMWPVADRETYDPKRPPLPITQDKILLLAELPEFIRMQIRKNFRKKPIPTIHLFVPRTLFGEEVEMLPSSKRGTVLGREYPFVVRTNLKTHPIGYFYYDDWNEKWEKLEQLWENKTETVFQRIDCSLSDDELIDALETASAAVLENCDSIDEFFELAAEESAIPVAVWARDLSFQESLPDVLDCLVCNFPERIRVEREVAHKSEVKALLGHHLSLVWEDPKIVPPDMQFDPEAC